MASPHDPWKHKRDGKGLTGRMLRFVDEYMLSNSATEAYIKAGYSPKLAHSNVSKVLNHPDVQEEISIRLAARAVEKKLEADEVLEELRRIVHADPRAIYDDNGCILPIKQWPPEVASMVASIEVFEEYTGRGEDRELIGHTKKIKFWDKNQAIEKAMKHLGQFEKDNKQKHAVQEMTDDQLDKFIAQKAKEAGVVLH
jgi:phage terminase small subunit